MVKPTQDTDIEEPLITEPGTAEVSPNEAAIRCQEDFGIMLQSAFVLSLIAFIFVGLPVMAGVCAIHKTETCPISGNTATYGSLKYTSTVLIGLNETVCYVSSNALSGHHLRINLHDVVFGVCGPLSILSITIWSIFLSFLGITVLGCFIDYLSKNRRCQTLMHAITHFTW